MRKALFLTPLFLTACGSSVVSLQDRLTNPLYAEQYYDAQVENMVNIIISSGAVLSDESIKELVDETRLDGLAQAKKANDLQAQGAMGVIMSDTLSARGEVLLLNGKIYTGPDFEMIPGIDVHVYLSDVVDPREGTFPDESAVDLGSVQNPFGDNEYDAKGMNDAVSLVLFDKGTNSIIGFAQLFRR